MIGSAWGELLADMTVKMMVRCSRDAWDPQDAFDEAGGWEIKVSSHCQ